MANNKVIDKEGNVLLDLTGDDVTEIDVMSGKKFHGRDGVQKTGTYEPPVLADPLSEAWEACKVAYPTNWSYAFSPFANSNGKVLQFISSVDTLNFSGSENVTDMSNMFSGCKLLTSVPLFNTNSATKMPSMFVDCRLLTSVPAFNTSNVTDMSGMFQSCISLTSVPAFNTSNVTDMNNMFNGCTALTSIPALDAGNCNTILHMVRGCTALTSMLVYNIKADLNVSTTGLRHDGLVTLIGNLAEVTSTRTLTMGSTKLALLNATERAIATNKGWTLA